MLRLFLTALLIIAALPATAQEQISIRTGVHPSYNRLVFDWPGVPKYGIKQEGERLTVSFEKAANLNLDALSDRELPNIKQVQTLSASGENLKVAIDIVPGSRFRHFSAGDRLV